MIFPSYTLSHGERYGRLTVLERVPSKRNGVNKYRCGCECGSLVVVRRSHLMKGRVKACGRCSAR